MSRNSGDYYFKYFIQGVGFACQAAQLLHKVLENYDAGTLDEYRSQMHDIEHQADIAKHEMTAQLMKEFITPIEREDIILLSDVIDTVTDGIEDVLLRLYMYNIKEMRPQAIQISQVIGSCCEALNQVMQEFHNFRKSQTIRSLLVSVDSREEDGDQLYLEAMHNLFLNETDPIRLMAWSEVFERLEQCCDNCEDVAKVANSIIMKNA